MPARGRTTRAVHRYQRKRALGNQFGTKAKTIKRDDINLKFWPTYDGNFNIIGTQQPESSKPIFPFLRLRNGYHTESWLNFKPERTF